MMSQSSARETGCRGFGLSVCCDAPHLWLPSNANRELIEGGFNSRHSRCNNYILAFNLITFSISQLAVSYEGVIVNRHTHVIKPL